MKAQSNPIFSVHMLFFTVAVVVAASVAFSTPVIAGKTAGKADGETAADIVVVLDLSGSMKSNGGEERFGSFFQWVDTFVTSADRVGVVGMGHGAKLIAPLTPKEQFSFEEYTKKLEERAKFTDVAAGLENAYYELKTNSAPNATKVILLLSDAQIDMPKGLWDLENSTRYMHNSLIPAMKRENVKIISIVPEGLKANFPLLQELANGTGGVYYRGLPANAVGVRTTYLKDSAAASTEMAVPTPQGKDVVQATKLKNETQTARAAPRKKAETANSAENHQPAAQTAGGETLRMELMILGGVLLFGFALVFVAIFVLFKRLGTSSGDVEFEEPMESPEDSASHEALQSVLEEVQSLKQESHRSDVESKQYMTEEDAGDELDFGEPQENLSVSLVAPYLDYEKIISEHPLGPSDEISSKPAFAMEESEDTNLSVSNMETLIGTGMDDFDEKERGEQ